MPDFCNEYSGFHPSKTWQPEIIESTREFFTKYVAHRKPVIIKGMANKSEFKHINLSDLKKFGGESSVMVERQLNGSFGHGDFHSIKFSEFLKELPKGELYLTTQYAENQHSGASNEDLSEDGSEDLGSEESLEDEVHEMIKRFAQPPLNSLLPDKVPVHFEFMENLVLQQMNLWMGYGTNKSSGLHIDFHDNLYVLKRGKKQFTIFSPKDTQNLSLRGKVTKVHSNGLIVFENNEDEEIRADGAYKNDVFQWKLELAEERLENAQTDQERAEAENELNKVTWGLT
jgi:hypothetical protein